MTITIADVEPTAICQVERMDKAVLVELSTALGGLVQSMYTEREMAKLVRLLLLLLLQQLLLLLLLILLLATTTATTNATAAATTT